MAKTLDKQKNYGTIYGDDQGRAFVQDNTVFDSQGNEWQPPAEPVVEQPPEPKKK